MTEGEMRQEFSRLTALGVAKSAGEQEQRERFAAECYRCFCWMSASQWKQVVNLVIERHKRGHYTIDEFRSAVGALRERGAIKSDACRSCGGTKWHYISLKLENDSIVDAVRPCATCRPGMVWDSPPNTVSYPMEDSWAVRMAKSMSPKVAYQVLERGNSMGIKFETEAMGIMVEKASRYEEEIEERRASMKSTVTAHPLGVSTEAVVGQFAPPPSSGNRVGGQDASTPSPSGDEPDPFI